MSWRYAKRSPLTCAHIPAQIISAIERRLIIAQSLYAVGAALCVINTDCSITFIFLVQLNYALHFRRAARSPGTRASQEFCDQPLLGLATGVFFSGPPVRAWRHSAYAQKASEKMTMAASAIRIVNTTCSWLMCTLARLQLEGSLRDYSAAPAPTATHARSEPETEATLNFFAAADMRINACAMGMAGLVSPFLALWKRTGLMRATT